MKKPNTKSFSTPLLLLFLFSVFTELAYSRYDFENTRRYSSSGGYGYENTRFRGGSRINTFQSPRTRVDAFIDPNDSFITAKEASTLFKSSRGPLRTTSVSSVLPECFGRKNCAKSSYDEFTQKADEIFDDDVLYGRKYVETTKKMFKLYSRCHTDNRNCRNSKNCICNKPMLNYLSNYQNYQNLQKCLDGTEPQIKTIQLQGLKLHYANQEKVNSYNNAIDSHPKDWLKTSDILKVNRYATKAVLENRYCQKWLENFKNSEVDEWTEMLSRWILQDAKILRKQTVTDVFRKARSLAAAVMNTTDVSGGDTRCATKNFFDKIIDCGVAEYESEYFIGKFSVGSEPIMGKTIMRRTEKEVGKSFPVRIYLNLDLPVVGNFTFLWEEKVEVRFPALDFSLKGKLEIAYNGLAWQKWSKRKYVRFSNDFGLEVSGKTKIKKIANSGVTYDSAYFKKQRKYDQKVGIKGDANFRQNLPFKKIKNLNFGLDVGFATKYCHGIPKSLSQIKAAIDIYTSAPCELIFYNNSTLMVMEAMTSLLPMPKSFRTDMTKKVSRKGDGQVPEFVIQIGGDSVKIGVRSSFDKGILGVQYKLTRNYDFSIDLIQNGHEWRNVYVFENDGFWLGLIDDLRDYVEDKLDVEIDYDNIDDVILLLKQTGNYVKDEFLHYFVDWVLDEFKEIFDGIAEFFVSIVEKIVEWF